MILVLFLYSIHRLVVERHCDVSDLPAQLASQSVGAMTASYHLLVDKYTEEKKERLKNEGTLLKWQRASSCCFSVVL